MPDIDESIIHAALIAIREKIERDSDLESDAAQELVDDLLDAQEALEYLQDRLPPVNSWDTKNSLEKLCSFAPKK